ncbi:putative beta-glucosidase M [Coleophoma cylindrospora]|uniref:beta-glucosidase n=1 Tax=Coleophoma cylindrospora TaxID=1849047 RepID=A0A3D8S768_9HELO|nr:putative beta-glucosidase M [Coleophoma cylindrospora]
MSSLKAVSIALLASLGLAGVHAADSITSDTYFYGQSPYVSAPTATGTGNWADAYVKAAAFVAQLSLDEKNNLTSGFTSTTNGCSGNIQSIPRLGFPGLCLQNAAAGVGATDFVNAYSSGIHVGASWNKDLAYQRAYYMGGEFRTKGVNIALGPVVGPLGRVAEGGRNWEGLANDPYLAGALVQPTVKGLQANGVAATTKHFIGNEQETHRLSQTWTGTDIESTSSNIDDKTIHELYLWPFQDAVKAGTGTIMSSYNRVNNSHMSQNSKALNGLLKTELGFQGFVMSDWYSQQSGVSSAMAGLDMAMPTALDLWGANMTLAIANGSIPLSRLDDMATRIMATWYQLGQDNSSYPEPGVGIPLNLQAAHKAVDARTPLAKPVLLQSAIEGHVLVKNTNAALPLSSPKLLSIFGYSAHSPATSNSDGNGLGTWALGFQSADVNEALSGFIDEAPLAEVSQIAINGTIISGGGSGANAPAYINAPFDALSQRAWEDGSSLMWDFESQDPYVEGASDACLVFVNAFSTEGADRPGLHDDYSDTLINNVADKCANTIVIIHNAGIRLVDQFIDHPNITALIFAHLPGQDSGRALTAILYGDVSPSGKLPYTVPKNESDFGNTLHPAVPEGIYAQFPQSDFTEGVYIDYRSFDKYNITPRYEFGYGLTYTSFSYSSLSITPTSSNTTHTTYPSGAIEEGGAIDLWDILYTVNITITNTGSVEAAEIAQLYISIPNGPVRVLRGFEKASIPVGQSKSVSFDLTRRDLSEWDTTAQQWALQTGSYAVAVGASSRDLRLEGSITI